MKKKLFIGTITPLLACIATIGSGFSLWIFKDSSEATASGSIGASVTGVVESANVIGYNSGYNEVNTCLTFIPPEQQIKDGYSMKNGYYGIYISNNNTYTHDQGYLTGKKERVVGSYYIPKNTSSYKSFLKATTANAYADGVDKIKERYGKNSLDVTAQIPESYIKGETDIIFTTTITVPKCIGQYINLGYKLKAGVDDIHDNGFTKVEYTDEASIYTIEEKYSELEPSETNDSLFNIVNLDYQDFAKGLKASEIEQVRMGYFFFDSTNLDVSYYNKTDGINCDDSEEVKAWHKEAPTTLAEYKEMREGMTNADGSFKSISISYKAEVIVLDNN